MTRAATLALVLAALIIGYVVRGERPSRPVRVTYVVKAECLPAARFKQVPKYRRV